MQDVLLKRSLKKGAFTTLVGRYSNILIQLAVTAVLARLLSPVEFGVLAQFMVFTVFFNLLGEIGIGPAIIHFDDIGEDGILSLFFVMAILGAILFFAFYISSAPISKFFYTEKYVPVVRSMAWIVLFSCLTVVPANVLRKRRQFALSAGIEVFASIVSGGVAVVLAYRGAGIFSLIWKTIIQSAMIMLASFVFSKIRLKFRFDRTSVMRIWSYSSYQAGFNILNYFSRNMDTLLIGRYLDQTALGFYNMAYRLMTMPITALAGIISPILQPIYSPLQADPQRIKNSYVDVIHLLAILGGFVSLESVWCSRELILLFCGPQWTGAISVFSLLGSIIWLQIILSSSGAIWQALGKTNYLFLCGIFSASVNVTAIVSGVAIGSIEAVAAGLIVSFVLSFIQCYWLMGRVAFHCSPLKIFEGSKRVILVILILLPISYAIPEPFGHQLTIVQALFAKGFFLLLFYFGILVFLKDNQVLGLMSFLWKRIHRVST
jgi:teichuronic acid exporter